MAIGAEIPVETEVFGVTYERYALGRLFQRLVKKFSLHSVIEMPASGAKAMPSLYSLGFASAGCEVTLVDADEAGVQVWRDLGLDTKLTLLTSDQVETALGEGRRWDLCWNFAVLSTASDPEGLIRRMAQCSRRWVMIINVNRFNVGFFLHRTVHRLWKIPWSHGDLRFFSPFKTSEFLRQMGFKEIHWGVVDCPPWPDSPGFRDLRLHRLGDRERRWISPYADYLKEDQSPGWLKAVYAVERLPLPAWLKLPYSHLYYAIARVDHEAAG